VSKLLHFSKFDYYNVHYYKQFFIHWRYDSSDFANHCRNSLTEGNLLPCTFLKMGKSFEIIGKNIFNWLDQNYEIRKLAIKKKQKIEYINRLKTNSTGVKLENLTIDKFYKIYIAAPEQEENFIMNVKSVIDKLSSSKG